MNGAGTTACVVRGAEGIEDTAICRLVAVDNDVDMLDYVREACKQMPDVQCVATFDRAKQALAQIPELEPDLALIAIKMPELDGLTLAKRLRAQLPRLKIIIFTGLDSATNMAAARKLGATGFLAKPFELEQILAAIQTVLAGGETEISHTAASRPKAGNGEWAKRRDDEASLSGERKAKSVDDGANERSAWCVEREACSAAGAGDDEWRLTDAEVRLLTLLAQGKVRKQIAAEIGVTEAKVHKQEARIYSKLHVHTALAALAKVAGLLARPWQG